MTIQQKKSKLLTETKKLKLYFLGLFYTDDTPEAQRLKILLGRNLNSMIAILERRQDL